MSNSYLNLLGLAYRARRITLGEEAIIKEIQSKNAKLVLIANDASENTKKKLQDKCQSYHVPYKIVGNRDELSNAIGKQNRVAVAVLDEGFSNKLIHLING